MHNVNAEYIDIYNVVYNKQKNKHISSRTILCFVQEIPNLMRLYLEIPGILRNNTKHYTFSNGIKSYKTSPKDCRILSTK